MKIIIVIMAALLVLSGCASSKALQISEAAGIGKKLNDLPLVKIKKAGVKFSRSTFNDKALDVADLGIAAGGAMGFPLFSGLGNMGNVAFGLLDMMTRTTLPMENTRILFWMPAELAVVDEHNKARSGNMSREKTKLYENLNQFVMPAFEKALPPGWEHIVKKEVAKEKDLRTIWMKGIDKARGKEHKTISFAYDKHYLRNEKENLDVFINLGIYRKQKFGGAPDILDLSGERMSYDEGVPLGFVVPENAELYNLPGLNILSLYQDVSVNLPDWAYIYVAPRNGLTSIPLMFHKGKLMLFMKPSDEKKLKTAMKE